MKKLVYIMILILMSVNLSGCLLDKYKTVEKVDEYGDRIEEIREFDPSEIKEEIDECLGCTDYSYDVKGKIVYITINFEDGVTSKMGVDVTKDILDEYDKEVLDYYDFIFSLKGDYWEFEVTENKDGSLITTNMAETK